ncbi:ethylene-responsive transcription factor 1A-like [Trifolium medium]|uniref:Ethylene-responsive transcription factor 1A-like n=1 Tax=Trifolium medium TaxID=97028 RepID=A0A392RMM3_9FABA|nr:ethylene-responsive transcription factor 1A-like [Trifolium medium]
MAYDRAAYRMRGSKAMLNFPLRVNSGEPDLVRVPSKRSFSSPECGLLVKRRKKVAGQRWIENLKMEQVGCQVG